MFDIELEFAPPGSVVDDPARPSLFTALREQLGLRFEDRKGPVEVLVIDSLSRATEN